MRNSLKDIKCPKGYTLFFCAIPLERENILHASGIDQDKCPFLISSICEAFPVNCHCDWAKKLKKHREVVEAFL